VDLGDERDGTEQPTNASSGPQMQGSRAAMHALMQASSTHVSLQDVRAMQLQAVDRAQWEPNRRCGGRGGGARRLGSSACTLMKGAA
jgi:hypothetical protein